MYSNSAPKKEERRDCRFDVDAYINFPTDFPASANVKPEHRIPQFCRISTPYSQQFSFAPPRQGTYHNPFPYSKFINICNLFLFFFTKYRCTEVVLQRKAELKLQMMR